MLKLIKEIENMLQNHNYLINSIIREVMKNFNLKTLCIEFEPMYVRKEDIHNLVERLPEDDQKTGSSYK